MLGSQNWILFFSRSRFYPLRSHHGCQRCSGCSTNRKKGCPRGTTVIPRSGTDARGFSRVQKVPEDVRLGREDARDARPSAIGMLDAPSGGCLDQRQQRESLGLFVWLLTRQEATTTGCQGCSRTMSDDAGEASAAAHTHTHTPTHTQRTLTGHFFGERQRFFLLSSVISLCFSSLFFF